MSMKSTDFLGKLCFVLLALLVFCGAMIAVTYRELQQAEKELQMSKSVQKEEIESRLEEMIKRMEKDE